MSLYFLSYSRTDEDFALRFAHDLIAAGTQLWVDQFDIRPSQHWDREVEAAVRRCQGLVVLLSPRSAESPNVADEVSVAIDQRKIVIPIVIEKCTPPLRMTRMQFIDATGDYARALQRCLAEIARSADPSDASVPPPARAPVVARAAALPPEVIETAVRRLTAAIGPIAARVVDAAAQRAATEIDLYAELATRIADAGTRKKFLASAPGGSAAERPEPSPPPMVAAADDLERIVAALTPHLGPIAAHLVKRESRSSTSPADLCRRLALAIPAERDRAVFLSRAGFR
ncbi:MAG: toll/interleukin-1 receptor domain-containing protein [Janthinobacterium lividum]